MPSHHPTPSSASRSASLPCQVVTGDLFFSPHPHEIDRAKAACACCAVRQSCLRLAVERGEPCGVWGGELFHHGVPVAALRRRGRPRRGTTAFDPLERNET